MTKWVRGGTHWSRPKGIAQWCMFWVGYVLYNLLFPVWFLLAVLWWKEDSAFILIHIEGLFFNPWIIWE